MFIMGNLVNPVYVCLGNPRDDETFKASTLAWRSR